jgi:AraC family transcriptional activator of mtrCDE
MARAAQLLSYSKMGTAQIGEAVGYQSEAAFNRVFKKFSGWAGAYRRKGRLEQGQGLAPEEGAGAGDQRIGRRMVFFTSSITA